ncbi:MAG: dGTPase [Desulfitobacteriaceae bacterium]
MKERKYADLLSVERIRKSSEQRKSKVDEFYSDRSRIIYSSSFRRLQQKAQVFSLEPNSSVRTRMTHSLEVSDLGRTLASKIAQNLYNQKLVSLREIPLIVAVVENACLLHDVGNPPFGHFGESAIREWSKNSLNIIAKKANVKCDNLFDSLISGFLEFDGNPQGFRIITKLHAEQDEFSLNLTYATLLCALKYSRAAGEAKGSGILKKAGYFQSEKDIVEKLYGNLGIELHTRYPLTYIMEAADDIAYCLSDISDGIEKRIITLNDFKTEFEKVWKEKYGDELCPVQVPNHEVNFSLSISIPWSKQTINEAASNYISNHAKVFSGEAEQLIPVDGIGRALDTLKQVSRRTLYRSVEAESIELTGYAVIIGMLRHFKRLLELPYDDFKSLLYDEEKKGLDFERRLYNRLGRRYVSAYKYATKKIDKENLNFTTMEWWLRTHLIIDHVSGMTDEFALETYQMLEGINLLKV